MWFAVEITFGELVQTWELIAQIYVHQMTWLNISYIVLIRKKAAWFSAVYLLIYNTKCLMLQSNKIIEATLVLSVYQHSGECAALSKIVLILKKLSWIMIINYGSGFIVCLWSRTPYFQSLSWRYWCSFVVVMMMVIFMLLKYCVWYCVDMLCFSFKKYVCFRLVNSSILVISCLFHITVVR